MNFWVICFNCFYRSVNYRRPLVSRPCLSSYFVSVRRSWTMRQHWLRFQLIILVMLYNPIFSKTFLPIQSSRVRTEFVGEKPVNPWEMNRLGRVMKPSFKVSLFNKGHNNLRKRFGVHDVDLDELEDNVNKHMYYAKSKLFDFDGF